MQRHLRIWCALCLTCLLLVPAIHARLGETEKQLIERFGPPRMSARHNIIAQGKIIDLGPQLTFADGEWRITSDMVDDRCVRINYRQRSEWTDKDIEQILRANAQNLAWTETTKPPSKKLLRHWLRGDGGNGRWSQLSGVTLTSRAYDKAKAAAEERARVGASRKPQI